jgi:hypothetical protein
MSIVIANIASYLMLASFTEAALQETNDPSLLVPSHEHPAMSLRALFFGSKSGDFVSVERIDDEKIVIKVRRHFRMFSHPLEKSSFPELDIRTASVAKLPNNELRVELKYGKPRPQCFLNDDGRNRVRVTFSPSRAPVVRVTSYPTCVKGAGE